jgi:hypothetical protein
MVAVANRAANTVSEQTGKAVQDYDTDTFAVTLCSDTFAASAAFTNISQFTAVASAGWGESATKPNDPTWTLAGADSTLQAVSVSWLQDANGPENIQVAVLHNTGAGAGNDDVTNVIDVAAANAGNPVSLRTGALNVNFSASPTLVVTRS